ncbi:hypothetical protein [Rhodococcoides fascians]|uniref:hypothetical protein n=1 Tax=Rhodococcoides fascians TaxID=1828 RepID=UPI00050C4277|nr:hypothetical protein [Rhodococcus fascians]
MVAVASATTAIWVGHYQAQNSVKIAGASYLANQRASAYAELYGNLGRYGNATDTLLSQLAPDSQATTRETAAAEYREAQVAMSSALIRAELVASNEVLPYIEKLSAVFYPTTTAVVESLKFSAGESTIDFGDTIRSLSELKNANEFDAEQFLKTVRDELAGNFE